MSFDMFPPSDVPDPVPAAGAVLTVRFHDTVEWVAGQLGEAERFERAGRVEIAAAYRRQAIQALDRYHETPQVPDACTCESCTTPTVFDQDDLDGYVTDDFDGAWARIKAWFGFGGTR